MRELFQRWPFQGIDFDSLKSEITKSREHLKKVCEDSDQEIWTMIPGDQDYPLAFLKVEDPPFFLRGFGSPEALGQPSLSVVGCREPNEQTLEWMEESLGAFLEDSACSLVSGGARGVDQAAHRIALRKGRPTVVMLPSGLRKLYPHQLEAWIPWIEKNGGCMLSEYDDLEVMRKVHFHQRNRLIPAISAATLIIEARRRSGTLITAQSAIDQGKPLWVMPSHPLDRNSQGSLDLLMDGATLVRDAQDLKLFWQSEQTDLLRLAGERSERLVVEPRSSP